MDVFSVLEIKGHETNTRQEKVKTLKTSRLLKNLIPIGFLKPSNVLGRHTETKLNEETMVYRLKTNKPCDTHLTHKILTSISYCFKKVYLSVHY